MDKDIENLPSMQGILEKYMCQISEMTSIINHTKIQYFEVLGDLIESIVGVILLESGFNTLIVWTSMKCLLDPNVTSEFVHYHPIPELQEFSSVFPYERITTQFWSTM